MSTGKTWLFTLEQPGESSAGRVKLTEHGPIYQVIALWSLLRRNEAGGASGGVTPVHTHPSYVAFFVLAGEQSIRCPDGVSRVSAGQAEAGQGSDPHTRVSSLEEMI